MFIYLDFETFWDAASGYTMRTLSSEEYVRDPRFEALLLGVAVGDAPVQVFEADTIARVVAALPLDQPEVIVVCQNYQFDGFILGERYHKEVRLPICNRALARWTGVSRLVGESLAKLNNFFGLAEKFDGTALSDGKHQADFSPADWARFKQYCADDVDQLRTQTKSMITGVPSDALEFIGLSELMYTRPRLELDGALLADYERDIIERQERDMSKLQHLFGFADREGFLKSIRGRQEFPAMLARLGVKAPLKVSEARSRSMILSYEVLRGMVPVVRAGNVSKADLKTIRRHVDNVRRGDSVPALAKTDPEFTTLMHDESNPDAALLCRVRAENNTSIELSRCRKFLAVAGRGTLPVSLSAYQAQTGRYTGDNSEAEGKSDALNLQNLAKHTGHMTLRRAVRAPRGYLLVAADSSQIEMRVNAWICGQGDLLDVFRQGRDPYAEFGATLYAVPAAEIESKATPELKQMRDISKIAQLSLGYGAGAVTLARRLKQAQLSLGDTDEAHIAKAQEIVGMYRANYPAIPNGWRVNLHVIMTLIEGDVGAWGGPTGDLFRFDGAADIYGRRVPSIYLPDGFALRYPGLSYDAATDEYYYLPYIRRHGRIERRKIYGGLVANNICQALSFALIRWQMVQINRRWPVVLNVHDEIVTLVPVAEAETALDQMIEIMRTAPPWLPQGETLPLNAAGGVGETYADV